MVLVDLFKETPRPFFLTVFMMIGSRAHKFLVNSYSFQRWRNDLTKEIRQNVHISCSLLPHSQLSLNLSLQSNPWLSQLTQMSWNHADSLFSLFPFSRCSNATGRSLGNFPFCSPPSLLLPSGLFLFYFHSADGSSPPLLHWPEWISCGLAHPWVWTGTMTDDAAVPGSQT